MGHIEKTYINTIKTVFNKIGGIDFGPPIPSDGLQEWLDYPYMGRSGNELLMDIIRPAGSKADELLPVVIYVHGGGLFEGNKNLSTGFCRLLALKGYVVFSLEYRLVPDVRIYDQIEDVCSGMDYVVDNLKKYGGDGSRIYLASESAGSLLMLYSEALTKSGSLQRALGVESANINCRAMCLISGMYYTRRKDAVGIFLSKSIYGSGEKSKAFAEYINPENPEIINNIPPVLMITSQADFLKKYTLDYAKCLDRNGCKYKLIHMGKGKHLVHAFSVLCPNLKESKQCIDYIDEWFERGEYS